MSFRFAAVAAVACALACTQLTRAETVLNLDAAIARVADAHPDLRLFAARERGLEAERAKALQRPAWVAAVELDNAFGSGPFSGLDAAELSLSLASVFERGGKLDARRTLAESRIDAQAVEREGKRLDLLAETARRYLAMVEARAMEEIASADIQQRRAAVDAAAQRHRVGAVPEAVLLTAQAALARAELDLARAAQGRNSARQHLAALWGERAPAFEIAPADPLRMPDVAELAHLVAMLDATPELERFVDQTRIASARLQLARSEASADLDWQVGLRVLEGGEDVGVRASLSMPLGARRRAQPGMDQAQAELDALGIEREAAGLALYATLIEAHGRYRTAQLEVERLRASVLPLLQRAEAASEQAWRRGASSYLEWSTLQAEVTEARRQQLRMAIDGQRALIEIQRLTGQPIILRGEAQAQPGASR